MAPKSQQAGAKEKLDGLMKSLGKQSFGRQLAMGAATGWVTGFYTMKIGRVACGGVGAGILIYEIARYKGLLKDWDEVKLKCEQTKLEAEKKLPQLPKVMCQVRTMANKNRVFAAGFVGGFLMGLAT